MYLQTKEEIKQHIGSKSLFKKIPQTEAVLNYVSGIQELTFERNSGKPVGRFFIAQYPYGILIADRKGKFRSAISIPYGYCAIKNLPTGLPELRSNVSS